MSVDLEKLNIIIESDSKSAAKAVDELCASLGALKDSLGNLSTSGKRGSNAVKTAASDVKDLGTTASNARESAEQLADSNNKVADSADKAGKSSKDSGKKIKESGEEAEKASGKLKALWGSLARIATYRLIRTALKEIGAAIKEGFNAFYEWDKNQNNGMAGFAKQVDELKVAWKELVGSIGPAIAAIWNIVGPVLTFIVHVLTEIIDKIQQIVRALQGETTWYKAVWREGKEATKAAKELQRVIFGFDELNILPSQNGSGTTGTLGYLDYEERPIPDWMKKIQGFFHGWNQEQDKNTKSQEKNEKQTQKTSEAYKTLAERLERLGIDLPLVGEGLRGVEEQGKQTKGWFVGNPIPVFFEEKSPTAQEIFNGAKQTLSQPITTPTYVSSPVSAASSAWAKAKETLTKPIEIPTSIDASKLVLIPSWVTAIQSALNGMPLKLTASFPAEAVSKAVNTAWTALQKFFNNNPIVISLKVGNTTTKKASTTASKAMNLWTEEKASLAAEASALSAAAAKAASTNPYANMSATDLVNYAQSTGLNLSATDKMVGAITAGTIAAPILAPAALALGTGASASSLATLLKSLAPVLGFASGGTPSMGTLFYAGERGAEVVADMGSRTGVMNVSQMEAAVASGNTDVVNAVYAMASMVVNAVNNKDFDVYMDAAKVGKSVTQYQNNQTRRIGNTQLIGG